MRDTEKAVRSAPVVLYAIRARLYIGQPHQALSISKLCNVNVPFQRLRELTAEQYPAAEGGKFTGRHDGDALMVTIASAAVARVYSKNTKKSQVQFGRMVGVLRCGNSMLQFWAGKSS